MAKQPSFIKPAKLIYGGSITKGHGREARPLCSKRPIHLVIKSSRATGTKSFLSPRYKERIETILQKQAATFGVKIYDFANGGNHLHLTIKIMSAQLYKKFIKALTGLIARLMTQAEKGRPKKEKFWNARPFTRVVSWGKAYDYLKSYFALNKLEALGFITYQDRKNNGRKIFRIRIGPFTME